MKNVRENQLKKCIYVEAEDFTAIVQGLFENEHIDVTYTVEGLDICTDNDVVDVGELFEGLAKYFDVKEVTSIHIDDFDFIGVWIVYKD